MNETQIDLTGERIKNLINNIFEIYSKTDSIWKTLNFFNKAHLENFEGLTVENLIDIHEKTKNKLHYQSIRNNIKRLLKKGFIVIKYEKLGKTGRKIMYKITTDGFILFEKYLKCLN